MLLFPRQDLAHGPCQKFGYSVADVRAGDQKHPIAQAAQREEAEFEKGDFRGGERTGGHALKMVARQLCGFGKPRCPRRTY